MSDRLGQKALDCLRLAADHQDLSYAEWQARYDELCKQYSAKAVDAMYESLSSHGYIEYGVSARMGWLTDKGRATVASAEE
jgi:hypothetical protein